MVREKPYVVTFRNKLLYPIFLSLIRRFPFVISKLFEEDTPFWARQDHICTMGYSNLKPSTEPGIWRC